jgi:UDP-galactopyranose mutase
MLSSSEVLLNTDYLSDRKFFDGLAERIIYTGSIDAFFDYSEGHLEYRTVRFETEILDQKDFQGNAVINYTDRSTPFTRIIEHKHFEFGNQEKTVVSKEFSINFSDGCEPYYPINDKKNTDCYLKYKALSEKQKNCIFGGRLGEYKYYNMDDVIESALNMLDTL